MLSSMFRKSLLAVVSVALSVSAASVFADRRIGEIKLEGVLTTYTDSTMTVAGQTVDVTDASIDEGVEVDSEVEIFIDATDTGEWVARAVELDDDDRDGETEIEGEIQSVTESEDGMLIIVIGGRTFEIDPTEVEIDGVLMPGQTVEIELNDDSSIGVYVISEIETDTDDDGDVDGFDDGADDSDDGDDRDTPDDQDDCDVIDSAVVADDQDDSADDQDDSADDQDDSADDQDDSADDQDDCADDQDDGADDQDDGADDQDDGADDQDDSDDDQDDGDDDQDDGDDDQDDDDGDDDDEDDDDEEGDD